jgi:signal transduction histidine kinase
MASKRTLRSTFAWRAALMTMLIVTAVGLVTTVYWTRQTHAVIRDGVVDHLETLDVELNLGGMSPQPASSPLVLPAPEHFVQVVGDDGRVVAASSELATREPVLTQADIDRAAGGDVEQTIADPLGGGEALIMARPITAGGVAYIGIVGASLARVDTGRRTMLWWLGLGVPFVGLVVWLGVFATVTYALRPVNAMAVEADRLARSRGPWQLGTEAETIELAGLALSLNNMLAQIREVLDRERRFLDDASHELRTPIAVARGELDLALGDGSRTEVDKAVASSIEELDRLDRLAADLLLLGRARTGDRRSYGAVDLGGVARRAAALVVRLPRTSELDLAVSGDAVVTGDEQALERALTNLITNAVTWCKATVEVTLDEVDGKVVVRVVDDGPGFPADILDETFGRFNRSDDAPSREGSGLGLAIAAEIIEAHDGRIEAGNRPDGGAEVTVSLPGPAG